MLNTLVDDSDPDVSFVCHHTNFSIDDVNFNRLTCPKSTIFSRLRKPFEEMGNRSGCRFVLFSTSVMTGYLYLASSLLKVNRSCARSRKTPFALWFRGSMGRCWCKSGSLTIHVYRSL
jgi:hypothetical protein